jgi:hypothetical protein
MPFTSMQGMLTPRTNTSVLTRESRVYGSKLQTMLYHEAHCGRTYSLKDIALPFPSRELSGRQLLTSTKLRDCQQITSSHLPDARYRLTKEALKTLRHCRGLLSPVGALKIRSCSLVEARKNLNCRSSAPPVTPLSNIYYFSCSVTCCLILTHFTFSCLSPTAFFAWGGAIVCLNLRYKSLCQAKMKIRFDLCMLTSSFRSQTIASYGLKHSSTAQTFFNQY